MHRRGFLASLFTLPLALCIPFTATEQKSATKYLYDAWRRFYKTHKKFPKTMAVSQELFDKFDSELSCMHRFGEVKSEVNAKPTLKFKTTTVYAHSSFKGWDYGIGT